MTDLDKALELARAVTKLAAGFPGHFFHDPECTDLVYIATDCEKQQCDCSVGEDCAVIVGACDGIDDVAEPLAQLLNAAGPLARALLALHARVEAMAAVVAAAEKLAEVSGYSFAGPGQYKAAGSSVDLRDAVVAYRAALAVSRGAT